jgi:hypothetical protein
MSSPQIRAYPQRVKNKTGAGRRPSSRAGAGEVAAVTANASSTDELQRLKDELRLVNQRLSKIGRVGRPGTDAEKNMRLPEKQDLLAQKLQLERKIRAVASST